MEESEDNNREINFESFNGIWIPKQIVLDVNLNITQKYILSIIKALDNEKHCYATNNYFAKLSKLSITRISNIIKELKDLGYILSTMQKTKSGSQRVLRINRVGTNNADNNEDLIGGIIEINNTGLKNSSTPVLKSTLNNNILDKKENNININSKIFDFAEKYISQNQININKEITTNLKLYLLEEVNIEEILEYCFSQFNEFNWYQIDNRLLSIFKNDTDTILQLFERNIDFNTIINILLNFIICTMDINNAINDPPNTNHDFSFWDKGFNYLANDIKKSISEYYELPDKEKANNNNENTIKIISKNESNDIIDILNPNDILKPEMVGKKVKFQCVCKYKKFFNNKYSIVACFREYYYPVINIIAYLNNPSTKIISDIKEGNRMFIIGKVYRNIKDNKRYLIIASKIEKKG